MSLASLNIPYAEIVTGGGSFKVRAIAMEDAIRIGRSFMHILSPAFNKLANGKAADANLAGTEVLAGLIAQSPALCAAIIAAAAGEPGTQGESIVRMLPFTVQTAALEKVFAMTFANVTPLEFIEQAIRMMAAFNKAHEEIAPELHRLGGEVEQTAAPAKGTRRIPTITPETGTPAFKHRSPEANVVPQKPDLPPLRKPRRR